METVRFREGQQSAGGFLIRPRGEGPFPAVILLPAIAGVNAYIRGVADRLMAEGFACLALDYYAREGVVPDLSEPKKIMAAVRALPDPLTVEDIRAGLGWLRAQAYIKADSIGTVGFCIGGTFAILAGTQVPGLACSVVFYGLLRYSETTPNKPVSPIDTLSDLTCPLLGHFGETDHFVSLGEVAELRERLSGRAAEIYTYPGAGHAFHEDFRPEVYRPVAAREAWQRTLTYLKWYLR